MLKVGDIVRIDDRYGYKYPYINGGDGIGRIEDIIEKRDGLKYLVIWNNGVTDIYTSKELIFIEDLSVKLIKKINLDDDPWNEEDWG